MTTRFQAVFDLIRFDKPYGTFLLLTPALWSLVIASEGLPSFRLVLIFTLGAFLMRSAGCAINDVADYRIDSRVHRTLGRPLPSGRLSLEAALLVFLLLSLCAFSLIWFLNPLTRLLSVVAISLAITYPFTKRFTNAPQFFMGVTFGWGAIMAWAAVRNTVESPAILIFLATLCWAAGYDTIYALMDAQDDRRLGIGSSALLFQNHTWILIGGLFALSLAFLVLSGLLTGMGFYYYGALLIVGFWFAYQTSIIRLNPIQENLFKLFKSNVAVGILILTGILLSLLAQ